jgi:hypothetical protein
MIPAPKLLPLLFPQYHAIPEVKIAMMMMMTVMIVMIVMMIMIIVDDCCCSVFDNKDNI